MPQKALLVHGYICDWLTLTPCKAWIIPVRRVSTKLLSKMQLLILLSLAQAQYSGELKTRPCPHRGHDPVVGADVAEEEEGNEGDADDGDGQDDQRPTLRWT